MPRKQPDFAGYERAKREWVAANPNASPEQYQKAMRIIAARYGV